MASGTRSALSEEMLRVIRGEVTVAEKQQQYKESLHNWWKDYSHRKNDEDDMVADSLLYDERCHLPRTAPGPKFEETEVWQVEVVNQSNGDAAALVEAGSPVEVTEVVATQKPVASE